MHTLRLPLRASRRRTAGFTLIELMITVAIIAILARIAYPIYTQSVMKSRRADAKAALLDLASREERYFGTYNQFTDQAALLGYASGATITCASPLPILSGSTSYYNMCASFTAASASAAPGFSASAVAVSPQTNDTKCKDFTINQAGVQGTDGTDPPANCW